MNKIVIIPSFAESHLIRCQIDNLVHVLKPDTIIYNEGVFPNGPEGNTVGFNKKKWCYKDTLAGFDISITSKILTAAQKKYPKIKFYLNIMDYDDNLSANEAYTFASSNFEALGIDVKVGTIIFPLEPDAFHHEKDSSLIHKAIYNLNNGEGLTTKWVDFLQTQYYTENINIHQPKNRRFAYKFDNIESYKKMLMNFTSQNYTSLKHLEIVTYHYSWFRPFPYKQLRYELIRRQPEYWKEFEAGLEQIYINTINKNYEDVVVRPSRNDASRFATCMPFLDGHPQAIKLHPNYIM